MQHRHVHKGINIGDVAATSCKNLENFREVTPEIMCLNYVSSHGYLAKIGLQYLFITLAFPNVLDDLNINGHI